MAKCMRAFASELLLLWDSHLHTGDNVPSTSSSVAGSRHRAGRVSSSVLLQDSPQRWWETDVCAADLTHDRWNIADFQCAFERHAETLLAALNNKQIMSCTGFDCCAAAVGDWRSWTNTVVICVYPPRHRTKRMIASLPMSSVPPKSEGLGSWFIGCHSPRLVKLLEWEPMLVHKILYELLQLSKIL